MKEKHVICNIIFRLPHSFFPFFSLAFSSPYYGVSGMALEKDTYQVVMNY
jgi:hypothetical protein